MKKQFLVKVTSIIVTLSILITATNNISAKGHTDIYNKTLSVDGQRVEITAYNDNDGRTIIVQKDEKKYEINVNRGEDKVVTTEYKYVGKNFFGQKKYEMKKQSIISADSKNMN